MLPAARLPITLFVAVLCMEICFAMTIQRNYDPRTQDDLIMKPVKKPFCNAFTGCGRKRSLSSPGMPVQELLKQRQRHLTKTELYTPIAAILATHRVIQGSCRSNITEKDGDKHNAVLLLTKKHGRRKKFIDEDNLTPLLDPENSMDERLSRQILTEAKLWEALQEATAELSRKKQREIIYN